MAADIIINAASLLNDTTFQHVQTVWHAEEVNFREKELFRQQIEDARRTVLEQAEQLKAISSLSALIAGFALIVQTNVSLDDTTIHPFLLYALALTTAIVVSIPECDAQNRVIPYESFCVFTVSVD